MLLPTGSFRITPSLSWARNGSGDNSDETTVLGVALEAGLPWGMSASMRLPYIKKDFEISSNRGVGDLTLSLAKRLNNETDSTPSFVVRGSYTHDSGDDPYLFPNIGSGFRSYSLALSGVKRFDPLVIYGDVSYSHAFAKSATRRTKSGVVIPEFSGKITPGDTIGVGLGVSLAATPDISLDVGVSLDRSEKTKFESGFKSSSSKEGYINLGAGIVLTKNLFLSLSASAGITDDATDAIFSVALPYRF